MPFYEYECGSCHHHLEALQKISDQPLQECPKCHKPALVKLISSPGFRLKGGGWYETDFKSGSKKNLTESEKPKESKETKESKDTPDKSASDSSKSSDQSK